MPTSHEQNLQAATDEADSIVLPRIDEAAATARPSTVGTTYVETEYDELGSEQQSLYAAAGESAARPYQAQADGLTTHAEQLAWLLKSSRKRLIVARKQLNHATTTLTCYTRRDRFAKHRYLLGWVILGLGDTAGILGAAIMLGEVPMIALGQALATGFAAVTSGQAGADLKDVRMSRQRQRDPDKLTKAEQRYRYLFCGIDAGMSIVRLVSWLSVTIVLVVSVGIFSLRWTVEGMVSGLAFGALAAATALGSFLSTYSYTDDVADLLATYQKRYDNAVKQHTRLSAERSFRQRATALGQAESVRREHDHRGTAASRHIGALCQRVLRRNPGVMGHGPASEEPTIIGRRLRGDAA
ncbi:hypothetical protein ACFCV3_00975 [Kribbella sp. NPDC056345]|uniref:hypothetical protein n=1 Tax=Kribbella sp. NPDC056345 TaxID=3345789 RepID=UPI0035DBA2D2